MSFQWKDLKMQSFVAIDFETANGKRASACSIGLARFDEEGTVVETYQSLILPHLEHRFFHPANTWVHGIREADVAGAPEWGSLFEEVSEFVGNVPLVAHNFGFDGSVLNQLTDLYQHEPMENSRYCTLRLARRLYPELPKKSLDVVFDHLFPGESLNHHEAEADAVAAGRIFAQMQRQQSLDEMDALLGPVRRSRAGTAAVSNALSVLQLVENFGQSTALQGESICFTGTLERGKRADLEEFLTHVGAAASKNITQKTTLLVVGVPNPSAWKEGSSASRKLERATQLREKGAPIRVLSEEDFFALLVD